MKPYSIGTKVSWKWYSSIIQGKVEESYQGPVEREIKGSRIKRNGTVENPAYLVRSEAGNLALKLHSELSSAEVKPR